MNNNETPEEHNFRFRWYSALDKYHEDRKYREDRDDEEVWLQISGEYLKWYEIKEEERIEYTLCKNKDYLKSLFEIYNKQHHERWILIDLLTEELMNTFEVLARIPTEWEFVCISNQVVDDASRIHRKPFDQILLERYPSFAETIYEVFEVSSPGDRLAKRKRTEQSSEISK